MEFDINQSGLRLSAKLKEESSLSRFNEVEKIDYPIFVPAKKRVRFSIHLGYPYPLEANPKAYVDERKKYRQAVEKYISDDLSNLDGFDLLDETSRYEIIFPNGMGALQVSESFSRIIRVI